jgi:hypothetical protein
MNICVENRHLRQARKRYMQGVSTYRHNGLTRAVASRSITFRLTREQFGSVFLPWFDIRTKEFKIFPPLFFGFDKPVMAIATLAHLLLPCGQANPLAKANKLNSYRTKQNGAPTKSRGVFAHLLPVGQKRKPQACGIFFISICKLNPSINPIYK